MNDEYSLEELAPWVAGAITLIGGLLRVFQLGTKGMWLDETFSVWLANQGVGDMLQWIVKIDQHPPLYYLLLHYWVALYGDTPYAARLLSAAVRHGHDPGHVPDRQTPLRAGDGTGSSGTAGFFTFQHLLRPGGAHVHPPGVQCRRGDLCAGLPADGSTRSQPHRQPVARISAGLADTALVVSADNCDRPLAWLALIVFSAATLLTHNTAVFFLLAINLFVLGLLLYPTAQEGGIAARPAGPHFGELGESADRHRSTVESLDRRLCPAVRQSLPGVLDSAAHVGQHHADTAAPIERHGTGPGQPGRHAVGPGFLCSA